MFCRLTLWTPFSLFDVYIIWQTGVFYQIGFYLGNLIWLGLQHMRHIAGVASNVTGVISSVIAAILASIVNRLFDGTPLPLILPCFIMACTELIKTYRLPVDNLDTPLNQPVVSKQKRPLKTECLSATKPKPQIYTIPCP